MTLTNADINQEHMITIVLKRPLHNNGMTLFQYADAVIAKTQPILKIGRAHV